MRVIRADRSGGRLFPARVHVPGNLVEVDADPQQRHGSRRRLPPQGKSNRQAIAQGAATDKLGRADPKNGGAVFDLGALRCWSVVD